jgi:tRNA(fMet)-specific endonuclease VapC
MGVVLDTSILVAAERRTVRFEAFLESLGDEPVGIAAISAAELLHGCHRASDPGVRMRRGAFVDALLGYVPVLPYGLFEARRHAELWAELAREGTLIGPHDLIISATALARGHALATLNRREFSRVAGLRLLDIDRFLTGSH